MPEMDPLVVEAAGSPLLPVYSGLEQRIGLGGLAAFQEGIVDAGDFAATASGAALSIDVAAGIALVEDDGAGFRRNRVICPSDAVVSTANMPRLNADGSEAGANGIAPNTSVNPRWDQIVAQFQESQRRWRLAVLTGTATAGAAMGVAAGAASNNGGIAALPASCARLHAFLVPANNPATIPQANIGNPRDPRAATLDFVPGAPPQYAFGRPRAYLPAARAYHSAAQPIGAGAFLVVALNSERFDTDAMHDTATNNSRVTCKTPGFYSVTFAATLDANLDFQAAILRNGNQNTQNRSTTGQASAATIVRLGYGDYVEGRAYNAGGTAQNVSSTAEYTPELAAAWLGP